LDAWPALWAAFGLFAAFCATVFRHSSRNPSEGGFDGALALVERGAVAVAALLPRRWRRASP
jgi:hypothetical protein